MTTFTFVHVAISLAAIGLGFVALPALAYGRRLKGLQAAFLALTIATSVTGFGFPAVKVTPGHVIGVLSLLLLAVAVYARYFRLSHGAWAGAYAVTATIAQYLNFFVLIVQSFSKVPVLHSLAPTQTEWPFVATQLATLVAFVGLGYFAWRGPRAHKLAARGLAGALPSRMNASQLG